MRRQTGYANKKRIELESETGNLEKKGKVRKWNEKIMRKQSERSGVRK